MALPYFPQGSPFSVMSIQHRYIQSHLTVVVILVNFHYLHLTVSQSFSANDHSMYIYIYLYIKIQMRSESHQTIHPEPNVNFKTLHLLMFWTQNIFFIAYVTRQVFYCTVEDYSPDSHRKANEQVMLLHVFCWYEVIKS